jgi:RNA polymerase sigma factor (sigma-70 family)
VSRAMSGVLEAAPPLTHREGEAATDHELVAAVRRGDDRAFECLYCRYHARIQGYVAGMCKDHARAEDITQEVFVSALRRMRETERPIAFKPWVYEIAKNACIDSYRRSRRAEEVSLDAEGGLAPADYGRLAGPDLSPETAVEGKQKLGDLCSAFGGLSETHHQILVLRELEGLSYRQIGERMGLSRPSVESTLFRARRRLSEEYDDLASGRRCLRIQGMIDGAAGASLGVRDRRRMARHLSCCQQCRRQARLAGIQDLESGRGLAARVAAVLPLPFLLRRFRTDSGNAAASASPHANNSLAQLAAGIGPAADQVGGLSKAAIAAAALAVAGAGAGAATQATSISLSQHPAKPQPALALPAAPRTVHHAPARSHAGRHATARGERIGTVPAPARLKLDTTNHRAPAAAPSSKATISGPGGSSSTTTSSPLPIVHHAQPPVLITIKRPVTSETTSSQLLALPKVGIHLSPQSEAALGSGVKAVQGTVTQTAKALQGVLGGG